MYFGEYVKGKKYGRWDISFKDEGLDWAEWMFRIIINILTFIVVEDSMMSKVAKMENGLN